MISLDKVLSFNYDLLKAITRHVSHAVQQY